MVKNVKIPRKTKKMKKIQKYYFTFFPKFSVKTGFQLFLCVKQLKFLLFYKKKNLKNIITDQTSINHISIKAI